ncbi:hypothetical protein B0T10DRAFT_533801 [Thelonectria olida]|uniref:Uncharacterized protein n=1 Tax=Thelonectria olida TaxID=1576542 RepID=A0A9P9AH10_9HYPO|nr:hypothetical protein B0T10DRAFT_533801 [Thelonectria olida]
MSTSTISNDKSPQTRKPLDSQWSAGGDMSIMFFVQPGRPLKFSSPDQHRVRGLNAETIARVLLPTPSWLATPDYSPLRTDPADHLPSIFFSLNLSLYNQQLVPEDWSDQWFYMTGRVHPFALTWELEHQVGFEEDSADDDVVVYTIPVLIVRDQGYQPLSATDPFPLVPPTVSFIGPVVGSGNTLLHRESVPALDDTQLKCCGFVQLTTFLAPGNSDKTPYRGFHPFQIFIIFPIHANPWASLCKKMTERRDTQFQSNVLLTCIGKVAGLLDHRLMVQPPALRQDYVFIVVPDSWTFLDKGVPGPAPPTSSPGTEASAFCSSSPSHAPLEAFKAKFTSRRPAATLPAATPTQALALGGSTSSSQTSSVNHTPPAKRPRQTSASPIVIPSTATPSTSSSSSQETVDEPETARLMHASVLDTITASVSEPSNRRSRSRHPPKNKYLDIS